MNATATQSEGAPARRRAVRIGAVCYLNTRPLIEALDACADVEVAADVPSRLLGALLEVRVDVALAPIVDAMTSPEPLSVLPCGCIASDGPTRSVKLFSAVPFERIGRLAADADSKTSVALARTILSAQHGASPSVERVSFQTEASLPDDADAILMIGDKVERRPPDSSRFPHELDLGAAWKKWTGLPFVYAAWVCVASRAASPEIRLARDLLDRQRRRNAMRLTWIASHRAEQHGWSAHAADEYLHQTIQTELGAPQRASIERFIREAVSCGALPPEAALRWMDG